MVQNGGEEKLQRPFQFLNSQILLSGWNISKPSLHWKVAVVPGRYLPPSIAELLYVTTPPSRVKLGHDATGFKQIKTSIMNNFIMDYDTYILANDIKQVWCQFYTSG